MLTLEHGDLRDAIAPCGYSTTVLQHNPPPIMAHSLTPQQLAQLQECLSLARDPAQHDAAKQSLAQLLSEVDPAAAPDIIDTLWNELLTARRSTVFWEQISDAEKEMGDRLAQDNIRLQQNYLRLMQEQ